jgi:phage shock protein A
VVHDLEPVLQLMAELEAQQPALRTECEVQMGCAEEWERRAMLAVNLGSDELAREALERRRGCLTWAARHRGDLEAIELFLGTIRSFIDPLRGGAEG